MHCTSADDRWSPLRVPIAPKACISSATCCGISPMRSIVYHQPIGLDIIKPKACILRPGIHAYARRFARSEPSERAPRSPSGECAPTHLRKRKCSTKTDPSQHKGDANASPLCWLGWPDLNRRMPESKSGALPLGDIPLFTTSIIIPYFMLYVKHFLRSPL